MHSDRRKRSLAIFLALAVILSFSTGCDDAYRAAAKGSDDVSSAVDKAIKGTAELYSQQLIDKNEKDAVAHVLDKITDANIEFRGNVKKIHANATATKADYIAAASGFVQSGRTLLANGDLNVKNTDAKKKLDAWLQAIQTGLDGVSLAIQQAKGK